MARDFNQNRIANAILGQATIDKYGNTFAVQFGFDGINIANVTVQPMPNSIIPYLEGDDTITQYAVPINVDELCDYALASFPNIEELTLFSLTMVTFDETNLLSYLANLDTVYVPQSLLSAYQSAYPNITFDEITVDYTYVVEDYTQDHVLTSEIITEQLNALTSQQRNAITKLVISSSYTSVSVDNVLWGYNFGALLPYLNNNIWYNGSKFDFSEYTIKGSGTLTSEIVESSIASISSDKISGITKVIVPNTFNAWEDSCLSPCDTMLPNAVTLDINTNNIFRNVNMLVSRTSNQKLSNLIWRNAGGYWVVNVDIAFNQLSYFTNLDISGVTEISSGRNFSANNFNKVIFRDLTTLSRDRAIFQYVQCNELYTPKFNITYQNFLSTSLLKWFMGKETIGDMTSINIEATVYKLYYPAHKYNVYKTNITLTQSKYIGVIDGANVYTDKGFSYQKLSSTLTLDTTNGHLMDNGVDLFIGYNATWYSDEDCTITIQPNDITSDMTVYVKLTAI